MSFSNETQLGDCGTGLEDFFPTIIFFFVWFLFLSPYCLFYVLKIKNVTLKIHK
jgi:hypothetical protein